MRQDRQIVEDYINPTASGQCTVGASGTPFASGFFEELEVSSLPSSQYAVANKRYVDDRAIKTIVWFKPGDAETGTDISAYIRVPFNGRIIRAYARAKTAPAGSDFIIDINKNGTTLWAANKLTIADGANIGSKNTFDDTLVSVDDYFTLDIDQIGSGTAGADLTIFLEIKGDI